MPELQNSLLKAKLLKRNNRFVAEVLIDDRPQNVYVPNTGRLSELALPGADVLLSPINGKYRHKILYIISERYPVMIDSTYSNRLFQKLLLEKKVPGLEDFSLTRREPPYGNHRFDFLIEKKGKEKFLELKSCTLFHNDIASFPDAVSERASDHIKLLSKTGNGILVFFILKQDMRYFIPNYHTDYNFYQTLRNCKDLIEIKPLSVSYNSRLEITGLKEVPLLMPEENPSGLFIIILKQEITGRHNSYFLLCGTDETDVFKKIRKFRNGSIRLPEIDGIDYNETKIITDLPVLTDKNDLSILDYSFSNKDCKGKNIFSSGEWRIYSFEDNPAEQKWFWDEILKLRFGKF